MYCLEPQQKSWGKVQGLVSAILWKSTQTDCAWSLTRTRSLSGWKWHPHFKGSSPKRAPSQGWDLFNSLWCWILKGNESSWSWPQNSHRGLLRNSYGFSFPSDFWPITAHCASDLEHFIPTYPVWHFLKKIMHELQRSCWSLYFSCLCTLYALAVLLVHFFIHNPLARQQGLSFSLLVRIKHMRSRDVLECCRSFYHERRLQIACPIHFVEPVCVLLLHSRYLHCWSAQTI